MSPWPSSRSSRFRLDIAQRLELREEGGELLFGVRDCGIGIPASEVEAVFERFRRGSTFTVRLPTGRP